jgi:aspartate racemase
MVFERMKTLGIVGGIGPESTIEYYRFILEAYRARVADATAPHLIIDSIDVNRGIAMLNANDLVSLTNYVSESVERLTRAGAQIALIAANTPHLVFDDVQKRATIPMISIVRATCDHAHGLGLKRLGLLGTGFTMRARMFPDAFARAGVELIVPNESEQALIHDKYINELLKNKFLPETRGAIIDKIERMRKDERIEALVLAGTELPLLLRGAEPEGLPFLDTTLIHVCAAVDAILA